MKFKEYLNEMAKSRKGEAIGKTPAEFDKAVKKFVKMNQEIIDSYTKKSFENLNPDVLEYKETPRYIKVIRKRGTVKGSSKKYENSGGSVHAFIDKATGDIYKPASWKAPAKHARGNIFDPDGGNRAIDPMSGFIHYMR